MSHSRPQLKTWPTPDSELLVRGYHYTLAVGQKIELARLSECLRDRRLGIHIAVPIKLGGGRIRGWSNLVNGTDSTL